MLVKNQQGVSQWAIIIVMAFMVVALIVAVWPQSDIVTGDDLLPAHIRLLQKAKNQAIDISEKAKIEKWITDNQLNQYGEDPYILYAGGTPLLDEATGETMDRYDYIIKNNPDKPWEKE